MEKEEKDQIQGRQLDMITFCLMLSTPCVWSRSEGSTLWDAEGKWDSCMAEQPDFL